MATNVMLQLVDGKGWLSVVTFSGLSHPMIMHPAVHGESALTAQAFHYLGKPDSVAQLCFEEGQEQRSNEAIEYLTDNYLFEYSKCHPNAKAGFKVSRGKFWRDDPNNCYIRGHAVGDTRGSHEHRVEFCYD